MAGAFSHRRQPRPPRNGRYPGDELPRDRTGHRGPGFPGLYCARVFTPARSYPVASGDLSHLRRVDMRPPSNRMLRRTVFIHVVLTYLLVFLLAGNLVGAQLTGSVSSLGQPIPGATVSAVQGDKKAST